HIADSLSRCFGEKDSGRETRETGSQSAGGWPADISGPESRADLDKRIQDLQELADNYSGWTALVNVHQRGAAHDVLESVLWIVLILLLVYLAGRLIDRFFSDLDAGRKRLVTLRAVTRFVIQAIGVVIILFVLFGMPNQAPTILGLAGAGLTVALKDF